MKISQTSYSLRRKRNRLLLWAAIASIDLLGLLYLGGCQSSSPPPEINIQVNRVVSGHTIEWIDRSQSAPVIQTGRLIGIDAPDLAQEPWGKQAKQRLEELVISSPRTPTDGIREHSLRVQIDGEKPDRFGRKFIYLWKDRELINEQLVREGLVLADTRSLGSDTGRSPERLKYSSKLIQASQYARLMGQGIWNPDLPMRTLPADFRREQR
jgi:micrococcal nuclease